MIMLSLLLAERSFDMDYSGSIRSKKNKDGTISYQIVIEGPSDPVTGKRNRSYQTVRGKKKDAVELMHRIVAEKNAGTYFQASSILLRTWLTQWFRDYCGNLERTTRASYKDKITHYILPILGDIPLFKLSGQDIQQWVNQISSASPLTGKPLGPKSVKNTFLVLRPALDKAVELHMIRENPCLYITLPKKQSYHPNVYNDEDIHKMLNCAKGTDLYLPLLLDVYTGLRRGELLALRWSDIEFEGKKITVRQNVVLAGSEILIKGPKTESGKREIAISDKLISILQEHYRDHSYTERVVCQANGKPYHPDSFTQKFQRFLIRNHLPHIRLHDLRHASATLMIEHGVDIKTVQARLGHADISTTLNIYSHTTEKMNRAAADKMDDILL